MLVSAIIGGSSIGATANFIPAKTSFVKNSWRSGFLTTMFAIPALIEYRKKRTEVNYSELLGFKQYVFLMMTLIC